MLKSWERSSPPLGWPRRTDSLCPECVKAARADILSGAADPQILIEEHVAEIKAQILVRDGKVVIEKACPNHGTFTDTLAIDPAFLERIESLFPGRDFEALTVDGPAVLGTPGVGGASDRDGGVVAKRRGREPQPRVGIAGDGSPVRQSSCRHGRFPPPGYGQGRT